MFAPITLAKSTRIATTQETLKNVEEVTMYIVPEATLLSQANSSTLMEEMLLLC